eukprot:TRINITY_DN18006_c0_g1_i2.p1 TRINITY_DN18006_c0_g1~~TRINITY_DN18006_c0_g1_i2.p1  ORF type:complete len:439 (+),score=57.65 TRINITY_DN18006_c0_g1_i2:125-1441(+)
MAFQVCRRGCSQIFYTWCNSGRILGQQYGIRFAGTVVLEDDMQDLQLSMQNEEDQSKKQVDPLSQQILQAKLLSDVEQILNKELNQFSLSHVNTCLLRISRQVASVSDGEKRRNVQEWSQRMENRMIERVKRMMPLPNSLAKAQLALNLARHTSNWRPTDFVDMLLLSISKNMEQAPEQDRQSMSLQGISISLLAAAFNKSIIASANTQLAEGAIAHLENNYDDATQIPSSVISALIYSVAMLQLKDQGNQIVKIIDQKGGFGEIQNDDHLSMLVVGLFCLEKQLSEKCRQQLEQSVINRVGTGKRLTQLQLSHLMSGCGGLRLLSEEQYVSICDRFKTEAINMKRAYSLNEVMLGLIARGYSADGHAELVAAIHAGCQQFLSPKLRKITKAQQLSLLRGLRAIGIDRLTLKSKYMELKFEDESIGEMLTIPQFGRDV